MAPNRTPAVLIACLALCAAPVFPQSVTVPVPEAPTTVFSLSLGSVDVDFSLLGSWTASLSFGTGLLFAPALPVQGLDTFPSLEQGILFTQTPDITAGLTILKRWFLDVSVHGTLEENSIQLGYRGGPGEVVRQVVLGTQDITIAPSTFLQVPSQPKGSLGAVATLAAGAATNDLLLRWDAAERKHKTFLGKNELVEQDVPLDSYTRGLYFFLPDTGIDPGSLQVLVEDPAGTLAGGDGGRYRPAGYDDVILDAANGLVSLRAAQKARVLVFYTKSGLPVGSAATGGTLPGQNGTLTARDTATTTPFSSVLSPYLGVDMTHRWITVGGSSWFLLWEPGDNSPLEIDNSYTFTATPPSDVSKIAYGFILKDSSAGAPSGITFTSLPAENRFQALPLGGSRLQSFYPFPDPQGLLYGPRRDSLAGALDVEIEVQFLTPVADMVLESDIVAGSVQVTVNGVAESRFEVDAASGKLTLDESVLPTDRIDVSWEKAGQGAKGGDVLLAWRDTIPLTDAISLTLESGIRWNANPWTYTQEPYSKSGTILAAAGVSGKTGPVAWSAQAAAAFTNPDTSGILRLFGMEGNGVVVDLSEDNAYPASTPVGLGQNNRGKLYYRDFRSYGPLGSVTLQTYSALPTTTRLAWASDSRMGPYNVAGDPDSRSAADLVFEYDLGAGQWVGAQLAIAPGQDADLSTARSVTIRMKGIGITNETLALELGAISEDLDGTGQLKAEASPTQAGFAISVAGGLTMLVGARPDASGTLVGNGVLDTEDRNGNGILDQEDFSRVVSKSVAAPGTTWTRVTIPLSDLDRQSLMATRGIRIVIRSGAGASGTIIIDSLTIDSSPFAAQDASGLRPNATVRQLPEALSQDPPAAGADFASKWPGTYKRFHPNAEENSVLEASWSSATPPLVVKGFVPQGTGGIQYDTIVSYIRSPTPGLSYAFSLLDQVGKGIAWTISGIDDTWHEVRVTKTGVTVSGPWNGAAVTTQFDAGYGSLTQLVIQVSGASASAGTFYLDEVFCTDPQASVGVAFAGTLAASFPGAILSAGGTPLLSDVSIRQDVALLSPGFASLYGVPQTSENLSSRTEVAADLLFTHANVNAVLIQNAAGFSGSGGHRITIPAGGSPVSVTDAFALSTGGGFSREDQVHVGLGPALDLALDAVSDATPDAAGSTGLLTQSWTAAASLAPVSPVTFTSTFNASQAVDAYPLAPEWYGARWYREAALVAPWEGGVDMHRAGSLDLKLAAPALPFGFSLEAQAGADASGYGAGGFTQANSALLSAALTAQAGSVFSASLSYSRAVSLVTNPAAGPRFSAEAMELGRVLALQGYLLSLPPVGEIFSDNGPAILPQWNTGISGSYTPTLELSLQRSVGSRWVDLVVPTSVAISLRQELKRQGDLSQTLIHLQPKLGGHALNLFGQLGAYPLLPWLRTDEYSLSANASLDGPPGEVPVLSSLAVQAFATLTGLRDDDLTLTGSLTRLQSTGLSLSNDLGLVYNWKTLPPGGVALPLLSPEIAATGRFEHRESATVTIAWQDTGSYHPVTVVLAHATSLAFPDHGTVTGTVKLGLDAENLQPAGVAWRIAVQFTLEGKLTF